MTKKNNKKAIIKFSTKDGEAIITKFESAILVYDDGIYLIDEDIFVPNEQIRDFQRLKGLKNA